MHHSKTCWMQEQFICLNTWTKKDSYPLPCIQEALESMVGSAHFLSIDFKSGFWQIKMAPESQQYMAFTVGNLRFYEFTHMLFWLCNTPASFQHLMENMLGELNLAYCVIYLDDVIIFGHTEEEHLEEKHKCLSQEVRVQVPKMAPMHIVDWAEAQEADYACCKWLYLIPQSGMPFSRSVWEWRLRQNRARHSSVPAIVLS